jgi:3-oxoacyl-[acyl-carrier-protein] synthase III
MNLAKKSSVGIIGIGSYTPADILSNSDLEKMVDTSDEWIVKRTGIKERRIYDKSKPNREMGLEAAKIALKDSGLSASEIDLIIVATCTPDYITPSASCFIQGQLGAKAAAFDLNGACSGFVYALDVASQFLMNDTYKNVLVVACEALSRVTDYKDRNTCVLFGDAAGAVVMSKVEEGYGILAVETGSDGSNGNLITLPFTYSCNSDLEVRLNEKKNSLWMNGTEVFKFASRIMPQAVTEVLAKASLQQSDIDLIIPHQANIRIIDSAAKKLGIPPEKVFINVEKYGNTSAASIALALSEAYEQKKVKKGDIIVLVGFGGGLTWGAAAIKWSK